MVIATSFPRDETGLLQASYKQVYRSFRYTAPNKRVSAIYPFLFPS